MRCSYVKFESLKEAVFAADGTLAEPQENQVLIENGDSALRRECETARIASFPFFGVRKLKLQLGESAIKSMKNNREKRI